MVDSTDIAHSPSLSGCWRCRLVRQVVRIPLGMRVIWTSSAYTMTIATMRPIKSPIMLHRTNVCTVRSASVSS